MLLPIHLPPKGRPLQCPLPKVEGERHQRIELAIGQGCCGQVILDTLTTSTPEVTQEVTPEVRLLSVLTSEMTRQQLKEALGLKDDDHFRKAYLLPALEAELIEMTIPDKPRSSKQKYRLTYKGRQAVGQHGLG